MIVFPHCKINLGLRILDQRPDGYHNIQSVFYPVQWHDALEVIEAKDFSFQAYGLSIDVNAEENLCVKAYRLMQAKFNIPPVNMSLLKNIPIGAGLGGGSSDAAFTLRLLNSFFKLNRTADELKTLAAELGSDCPFFLEDHPCLVSGRGDDLQPVALDLSPYHVVILHPPINISTAWAYQQLAKARNEAEAFIRDDHVPLSELNEIPVNDWKQFLVNDFEPVILKAFPKLEKIKRQLYERGALYASMSGSGSAIYGIFESDPHTIFDESFNVFSGRLSFKA